MNKIYENVMKDNPKITRFDKNATRIIPLINGTLLIVLYYATNNAFFLRPIIIQNEYFLWD